MCSKDNDAARKITSTQRMYRAPRYAINDKDPTTQVVPMIQSTSSDSWRLDMFRSVAPLSSCVRRDVGRTLEVQLLVQRLKQRGRHGSSRRFSS